MAPKMAESEYPCGYSKITMHLIIYDTGLAKVVLRVIGIWLICVSFDDGILI
jgi:hypothetical protein